MSDVPHADGGTIVVTAENLLTGTGIIGSGSGGRFLPRQPIDEGGGGEEPPPEEPCVDVSAYPPEKQEALKVLIAAMAAARTIYQKSDRDTAEYGIAGYRDRDGNIRLTSPYSVGSPTETMFDYSGLTSEEIANIVFLLHSHTAVTWFEGDGERRLRPTNPGDWDAFDWFADLTASRIQQTQGISSEAALAQALSQMSMFIFGPTGPVGSEKYALRLYGSDERGGTSDGTPVDWGLEACSG